MKGKQLEIQQVITEIDNPCPDDNLISNYKDFLKIRDILFYYQFNFNVFQSLVELTFNLWDSTVRINRISLLQSIRKYGYYRNDPSNVKTILLCKSPSLPIEINIKLFWIFKQCYNQNQTLSKKRVEYAAQICNTLLINRSLCEDDEKWLCENAEKSEMILNRLLRYPQKSVIITAWSKENFGKDKFRNRRAELISWIIDYELDFVIDREILIEDFEYLNSLDKKIIDNYIDDKSVDYQLKKELNDIFSNKVRIDIDDEQQDLNFIKLNKRFYPVPMTSHRLIPVWIPDFESLNTMFFEKFDTIIQLSMVWGIAYSRISIPQKTELLKKYYSEETYWTLLKICKRYKLLDLLKWLKEVVE
jgi:hypothetical protein